MFKPRYTANRQGKPSNNPNADFIKYKPKPKPKPKKKK